jgi:hypothetical protein
MIKIDDPFTKPELLKSFGSAHRAVSDYFASIAAEKFFDHSPAVWSPAENLVHLIKSVSPVARAMKLPRLLLFILFGAPQKPSKRFVQIKEEYRQELAKGARATRKYIPVVEKRPPDFDHAQRGILRKWDETSKGLLDVLQGWNEERLDKYFLPHPILGKLTIREMLFFTLYHDLHHVNNVRKLLGQEMITI